MARNTAHNRMINTKHLFWPSRTQSQSRDVSFRNIFC